MLEFGIFDHVDSDGRSLGAFYEQRLKLIEQVDRSGFLGYHVAEHHFTPLGLASSPGIYLSAVAQRSRKLRFGPLVYTLPLYHPLRLAEEICMLDQMSGGRLDVGVGRGISPIEASYFDAPTEVEASRAAHLEAFEIVRRLLQDGKADLRERFRSASNVPMQLTTIQKPHPPFWMGVATLESAEAAAKGHFNFVASAPAVDVAALNERYIEASKTAGHNPESAKRGLGVFIFVGETDAAAEKIAARAYRIWHRNFNYLYALHNRSPVKGARAAEFSDVQSQGRGIAGSPRTVTRFLREQVALANCNYLVGQFFFGDLTHSEASRSIELFSMEVAPDLRKNADQIAVQSSRSGSH